MRLIRRYLSAELLKNWLLVTLVLSAVFALILFIEEVGRTNERYTALHALSYIALSAPQRAIDLAPVSVLLGTLMALGSLARYSETTVILASGVSVPRLVASMWLPLLLAVIVVGASTEYLAAPLLQRAETERAVVKSGKLDLLDGGGLWANDGGKFINVRNLRLGRIPSGIDLFEFDSSGRLIRGIHGAEAEVSGERRWTLKDVQRKDLVDGQLQTTHLPSLDIGPFWSQEELPVLAQSPAGMKPSALAEYVSYLESTGQNAHRFRLVLWQKLTNPLAVAVMILFAAPIGIGSPSSRSASFGLKLTLGAMFGIGFYMLTQIVYNAGMLFDLPAPLVALGPPSAILLCAIFLLLRRGR